ncbi:CASP-like protein PIMP1 [Coffea arabica]|uniref:CASP-like protein n=1 Tax=Coffea arabica TaxID=13443 RepID=A0A6P6VHN1_COFAR|nr:CASP-like protein PIMP1 [Coffea arabica]
MTPSPVNATSSPFSSSSTLLLNTVTTVDDEGYEYQIRFNDFYAYRYLVASAVVGIAFTLIQSAFDIFKVSTGNRPGGAGFYLLDFYADKVTSYLLATGAAAGFGLSVDLNRALGNDSSSLTDFLNKGIVAASIFLVGFVFSAVSSVFSS